MVAILSWFSAAVCVASAVSCLARRWWIFELATHFRVQYAALLAACTAAWLALGRPFDAAITGTLALVNGADILRMYRRRAPDTSGRPAVRVLMMNVNTVNPRRDRAVALARRLQPDVVVVIETHQPWVDRLAELRDLYPFFRTEPRDDGFGMTVLSRLPVEHHEVLRIGRDGLPCHVLRVPAGGRSLTVVGVHPHAPVTRSLAAGRNEQFSDLARFAARTPGPLLMTGDFNCAPWSPYFQDLLRATKLHDSRHGFGLQPSWPVQFLPLRIPIDHCLVSDGVAVHSRRIADDVGSDHFPVLIECSVTP
jgi:endonuclease/exonuclease/phosphatase (EEP) superfamily protein YafD